MMQFFVSDPRFLQRLQQCARQQDIAIFYLDGTQIKNKNDFFKEIATVMQFPEYFGENWDALQDCLTDLSWCAAKEYWLIYDNARNFAHATPDDWQTLCGILQDTVIYWQNTATPLTWIVVGDATISQV
ncbi:MAG: barstar family protein [Thiotrichaceae bacterium]